MTGTAPCSTSAVLHQGGQRPAVPGATTCATMAAARTRAAPTPATCTPITCGTGYHGGPTNLANLVLLCAARHRAHHNGKFRIQRLGRGRFRFLRADGRLLPDHVDPGQAHRRRGSGRTRTTPTSTADARHHPLDWSTASTGTTPSASSRNAENNCRDIGPKIGSGTIVLAEHAAHRPSSSTV